MNDVSAFSSVVFPAPVPPEIRMLQSRKQRTPASIVRHVIRERAVRDQPFNGELGAESSNRQYRPVDRERRDDRVDARSVGKTGIDHRRRLVHAAADAADDAIDHRENVRIVAESEPRRATAFRARSMKISFEPLTRMSLMVRSRNSGSIGPSPVIS